MVMANHGSVSMNQFKIKINKIGSNSSQVHSLT